MIIEKNWEPEDWRTEQYWTLPENVRNAIDKAKSKKTNSDFYYRLKEMNEKLHIFTQVFYKKMPGY